MNASLPKGVLEAIEHLSQLPGIGSRSAERLIFSLLKNKSGLDQKISNSLNNLRLSVRECEECFHFCEKEKCGICGDSSRNEKLLCIVETPLDVVALERTHEYKGIYHVLHGIISPINKIKPEDLKIPELIHRLQKKKLFEEIILATSGSIEGDATAMYICQQIKPFFKGKISRIARGIPAGGDLDFLDLRTISRAITERREF